jgi:hypothetical protein
MVLEVLCDVVLLHWEMVLEVLAEVMGSMEMVLGQVMAPMEVVRAEVMASEVDWEV